MAGKGKRKDHEEGIGLSYTLGLMLGIAIGVGFGLLVKKLFVGMAVGVVLGIWFGSSLERSARQRRIEKSRKQQDGPQ